MFTLKFYSYFEDGSHTHATIACPHYSVYYNKGADVYEVSIYKEHTSTEGVVYNVAQRDIGKPYWETCYVENSSGKTIERFG